MYIQELDYNTEKREFFNFSYDGIAALLLKRLTKEGLNAEKEAELRRCLTLGRVRADWLLPLDYIEDKLCTAQSTRDRNYWLCIKKLQHMRS